MKSGKKIKLIVCASLLLATLIYCMVAEIIPSIWYDFVALLGLAGAAVSLLADFIYLEIIREILKRDVPQKTNQQED
jgi:hypothetical protein